MSFIQWFRVASFHVARYKTTMKTTATRILSVLIAVLLIGSVAERIVAKEKKQSPTSTAGATHKPTPTATPHQESGPKKETSSKPALHVEQSLRTEVNTAKLHDGSNLIHSGDGLNV